MSRWFAQLRVALRSLLLRKRADAELDEELQYHLEREIQERQNSGLTSDEARYAALKAMGAIARSKDESRDLRTAKFVEDFLGDVRQGGRTLLRSPGFSMLAIAVMALGIGANTAVFSIVNGVLLKPLPYSGADRIVTLSTALLTAGEFNPVTAERELNPLVTIANFRDWRDQSSTFEAMSSYRPGETSVTTGTEAEYGRTASVDAQFFQVFAVEPIIGRTFTPAEVGPGAPAQVLISHSFWQSRLAGDAQVLERTIRVGNASRSIIGVLPAGFRFPGQTDVWLPQTTQSTSRTGHNLFALGRLKPGVPLERAQADLTTIAAGLEQQYPESNKGRGVHATRLQDHLVGDVRLTLYLLWGVVGIVLLIACANTATLLLGKATSRSREIAVRTALGATRRRIVQQLITESLLLALTAGACGMLLAQWGTDVLVSLAPVDVMRSVETGIDGTVLGFTLIASILTSVVFGLVPALHASKIEVNDNLNQGGSRSVVGGRVNRTRSALVVSEIALAVVLLVGAGLLLKSVVALHAVDLGFQPQNALVMKATGMRSLAENNAFFRDLFGRIAVLPGVVAVGATSTPPGDLSLAGSGYYFVDRMPETRDRRVEPQALLTIIAPGLFDALGIPLKAGRDFDEGDGADRPQVAIVNEALVRKSFGGNDPIGRTIFCPFDRNDPMTIVGVVGDVHQRNPAIEPTPECFFPYSQHNYNSATLNVIIRTAADPNALTGTVRQLAAQVSPNVPVSFTTMEEKVSTTIEGPIFRAQLFAAFAGLAICLAMAGVYGVMAHAVQQRSSEIGLRMSLGASRASVLWLILRQSAVFAAVGLATGLAVSAAVTQVMTTVLFNVERLDVQVYLIVAILLTIVTLVAGYVPARRASIVDPVEVLRSS